MRHFVLKKAQPVYSDPMLQMRIQGTVVPRVIVDKSGVPNVVSIVSGHPSSSSYDRCSQEMALQALSGQWQSGGS